MSTAMASHTSSIRSSSCNNRSNINCWCQALSSSSIKIRKLNSYFFCFHFYFIEFYLCGKCTGRRRGIGGGHVRIVRIVTQKSRALLKLLLLTLRLLLIKKGSTSVDICRVACLRVAMRLAVVMLLLLVMVC